MWICPSCQYENLDGYERCMKCDRKRPVNLRQPPPAPRPAPKAAAAKAASSAAAKTPPAPKAAPKAGGAANKLLAGLLILCGVLFLVFLFSVIQLIRARSGRLQAEVVTNAPAGSESVTVVTPAPTQGGLVIIPTTIPATPAPTENLIPPQASTAPISTAPVNTPAPAPGSGSGSAPVQRPGAATAANGDGYLLPMSASRYLTAEDLAGMSQKEVCLARNEIYARRGRIFQNQDIAAWFNAQSWYSGTVSAADFDESVFGLYESANIQLIQDYEQKTWGGSYY